MAHGSNLGVTAMGERSTFLTTSQQRWPIVAGSVTIDRPMDTLLREAGGEGPHLLAEPRASRKEAATDSIGGVIK